MRIALIGPYPPYRGGIAHFAVSVRRELVQRGHDVWALTFSRQYPRLLFPGQTEFETASSPEPVPALRVLDSLNPISWLRTGARLRALNPHVILYSYWLPFFAPAYGVVARRVGNRARHLAIVHNALPHERRPGDEALSRYFLRSCDGILTMSEAVESDVRRLLDAPDVRRVAHPTYDVFGPAPPKQDARAALGLLESAPVALFFGFVRQYKGLDLLLQSLPAVVQALPDFRLIVAGEFYEPRERYDRLVREHGLESHVDFHDAYIPSDEVGRYFSAADVVVQPYRTATQSGVAQIAWHFERPLIVTDVGGLAEVVPDGIAGLVVPPDDPAGLAEAIRRFFQERMGSRLSDGARNQKLKYGWGPLVDALERLAGSGE